MKILIIGINYSPEPTGSAPYTSGVAEMLVEDGHQVMAIVGIPHYPDWKVATQDKFRLRYREVKNGVLVHHFRHFVPKKQTPISRILWELTFLLNVVTCRIKMNADLVFCSTPSLSGGLLGLYFSRRSKAPQVSIVQDLVGLGVSQSGLGGGNYVSKIAKKLEKYILINSARVAIVTESFSDYLTKMSIKPSSITIFPNWAHIPSSNMSKAKAREFFGWDSKKFIVLHTGNMGLKQNLENLIEASKLFIESEEIAVVLCGEGSQRRKLEKLGNGISSLSFMEPVDALIYPNLLLAADLLIVCERPSVGNMSLPSKLTSYFFSGTPVLASVDPFGACAKEISKTNGAAVLIPAGKPVELALAIRTLKEHPDLLINMGIRGKNYSSNNLTRDAAKIRLRHIVEQLVEFKNQ